MEPARARSPTRSSRRSRPPAPASSSSSTQDVDLDQVLRDAAARVRVSPASSASGRGTGLPTGRMPDRGVDRPPYPDEVQHARRYANRLRQAITHGTRQIDKRTPGGRFDGRAYARGRAEQAAGRPISTHPWRITRQVAAPIQEPHVGLVIDTSGSMSAYEYALGPIAWILTDGLRQIGGRCATALFGNSAELLADGTPAAATRPWDPHRRRHRVRRRRDRARLRPARDDQPAPPPVRLRPLRRRLGGHPRRGRSGSGGSPSSASRRSTSRSGSRRCRSSATASP